MLYAVLGTAAGLGLTLYELHCENQQYKRPRQSGQQTTVKTSNERKAGNMDDLKELRALRDRLLQSIGWYTGKAENGSTEVKTDDVSAACAGY